MFFDECPGDAIAGWPGTAHRCRDLNGFNCRTVTTDEAPEK